MAGLASLDWHGVRHHYNVRRKLHKQLMQLHDGGRKPEFANLFLGISDGNANYSAAEHDLGPKVMRSNFGAVDRVFDLAAHFRRSANGRDVPRLVTAADLSYLGIGVGSEGSCLVNPHRCWVANTRSIWAHLLVKHADNVDRANEELALYRDADASSEMHYALWSGIHGAMESAMTRLAEAGDPLATAGGVKPGKLKYLWADAIANALYEHRAR